MRTIQQKEDSSISNRHPEFMTTKKERLSSWTYFIGQNIYYNITAAFISTYLAMQGIHLAKVAVVLLIGKIGDAVYTLTDVPAYAMRNTMTDNLQERNTLLSINRVFSGGVSCAAFCFYGNLTHRSQFFYEKFISRQKCVLLDTMYGILHLATGFPWIFVVPLHRNTFVTGLYLDKPKALWQYIVEVDAF